MKKWLLRIHLYGGLFAFWNMLIIALSSWYFQHPAEEKGTAYPTEKLKLELSLPESPSDSLLAITIQNKLNIAGWYLPWETWKDESGAFHTKIVNPAMDYDLTYFDQDQELEMVRSKKSFWRMVVSLHGFSESMPNAPWLIIWGYYTWISLFIVLFSLISGIWLWIIRESKKKYGWITLTLFAGIFIWVLTLIILKG